MRHAHIPRSGRSTVSAVGVAAGVLTFSLIGAAPASARPADALAAGATGSIPVLNGSIEIRTEQHTRSGGSGGGRSSGGGGGQAVPRGGSGSSGGASSGGGSTRSGGGAVTRGSGADGSSGGTRARTESGASAGDPGSTATAGAGSRAREGRPVTGTAVERRDSGGGRGGDTIIVGGGYYGGFYPWGWGGLGVGGYYGWYDPWGYDPYPPYGYGGYGSSYYADGGLKLKVKPRQAEVFVDGYFAGAVDDYDGAFQRLRLEPGPHRVEVRLDGYEPLSFDVRILPDRTITYKGEMRRVGDADDSGDDASH